MSVKVEGIEEVIAALEELGDVEALDEVLGKACALVERSAKQKAPKNTGELQRSITSKIEHNGDNVRGVIYTPLHYAPYVEFGTGLFAEQGGRTDVPWWYKDDKGEWHRTSGQHPQPYMRPALEENREQILRIIKEALRK